MLKWLVLQKTRALSRLKHMQDLQSHLYSIDCQSIWKQMNLCCPSAELLYKQPCIWVTRSTRGEHTTVASSAVFTGDKFQNTAGWSINPTDSWSASNLETVSHRCVAFGYQETQFKCKFHLFPLRLTPTFSAQTIFAQKHLVKYITCSENLLPYPFAQKSLRNHPISCRYVFCKPCTPVNNTHQKKNVVALENIQSWLFQVKNTTETEQLLQKNPPLKKNPLNVINRCATSKLLLAILYHNRNSEIKATPSYFSFFHFIEEINGAGSSELEMHLLCDRQ